MAEASAGYAEVQDVLARAGVLARAWDESTSPGTAEIEQFIRQTAAEINAGIGALGYSVPVQDVAAANALTGYNADKALLLAIDATWPGSSARDDVADLRTSIQTRLTDLDAKLASGDLAAVLLLAAQQANETVGGASNFWDVDGPTYYGWWSDRIDGWVWNWPGAAVLDVSPPEFTRGMKL